MPDALLVLVYALAVARLTRLVTSDKITEGPRDRYIWRSWGRHFMAAARKERPDTDRAGHRRVAQDWARTAVRNGAEPPLRVYLATCPWCVSIYVAAVAAPLAWFWGSSPWLAIPALALAFSQVTGFLATKED